MFLSDTEGIFALDLIRKSEGLFFFFFHYNATAGPFESDILRFAPYIDGWSLFKNNLCVFRFNQNVNTGFKTLQNVTT